MADAAMEEALAKQRASCPFCRIIAGEIPAMKVYEDDGFVALLDIRPAVPGHVLLVPRDHAPILQLLPEPRLRAVFPLAARLAGAVKDAMIARSVNVVVVNGLAPGQQSPHALVHIIPRDSGDGLDALDLTACATPQSDTIALGPQIEATVREVVTRLGVADAPVPPSREPPMASPAQEPPARPSAPKQPPPQPLAPADLAQEPEVSEFTNTQDALAHVLELHPDLRNLLIAQPSLVEEYVRKSPRLAKLFAGVDVHALSAALRAKENQASANTPLPRVASQMSDPELFSFIDGNEGLRTWLLESPDEFVAHLDENPRLAAFFADVDVRALANRFAAFKGGDSS